MSILSIQSHVSYGHVGNSAAVFPMQRLGFDVWPVHTVIYSNHKGYGDWRGPELSTDTVAEILAGVEARGAFETCRAVLTGFIGASDLTDLIVDTVRKIRKINPDVVFCCDPVMGDVGPGLYVPTDLPDLMRDRLTPAADIVTPNQFELQLLTGIDPTTLDEALRAADSLVALGPRMVLVTSLHRLEGQSGEVEMLLVTKTDAWLISTPLLDFDIPLNGSGDMTAALFLAHYLKTGDPAAALATATASIFAVFEATHKAKSRELKMIAAQDEIFRPSRSFPIEKVR